MVNTLSVINALKRSNTEPVLIGRQHLRCGLAADALDAGVEILRAHQPRGRIGGGEQLPFFRVVPVSSGIPALHAGADGIDRPSLAESVRRCVGWKGMAPSFCGVFAFARIGLHGDLRAHQRAIGHLQRLRAPHADQGPALSAPHGRRARRARGHSRYGPRPIARWPCGRGRARRRAASSAATLMPPADSPNSVTLSGSPPNSAMFRLTQSSARIWSARPSAPVAGSAPSVASQQIDKAERAQPVIDRDDDDVALRPGLRRDRPIGCRRRSDRRRHGSTPSPAAWRRRSPASRH